MTALERLSCCEILAQYGHFSVKEQPHKPKDTWLYLCPFHADSDSSFSVHENGMQWKCWVCGIGGGPRELLRLFGDNYVAPPRPVPGPKKSKKSEPQIAGCTLAQLAKAKGLPIEYLRSLGWHDTTYAGKPAVAVPWPGGTHYRVNLASPNISGRRATRSASWALTSWSNTSHRLGAAHMPDWFDGLDSEVIRMAKSGHFRSPGRDTITSLQRQKRTLLHELRESDRQLKEVRAAQQVQERVQAGGQPPVRPPGAPLGIGMRTPDPGRPDIGLSDDLGIPTHETINSAFMRKWEGARLCLPGDGAMEP